MAKDIRNPRAYIRSQRIKERKKLARQQRLLRRAEERLATTRYPHLCLAVGVKDYVERHGNVIWGNDLEEIYQELAQEVLHSTAIQALERIKKAIAFACASEWLERSEAKTAKGTNLTAYFVPRLKPNRDPQSQAPELATAA